MRKMPASMVVVLLGFITGADGAANTISLRGEWDFALDQKSEGVQKEWFKTTLPDTIKLPGTTDENLKGAKNTVTNTVNHLSRLFPYYGQAWYQKQVVIPEGWRGKRITLCLERTKSSSVWVDDKAVGLNNTMAGPQVYDLTAVMSPGKHRITILVDNGKKMPVNGGHQLSEDTQTNWNGILGKMELKATSKVWIDDVQIYPDVKAHKISVAITLGNISGTERAGIVEFGAKSWNEGKRHVVAPASVKIDKVVNSMEIRVDYEMGKDAFLWDEFSPVMYRLMLTLKTSDGVHECIDNRDVNFGMVDFKTRDGQFCVNGNKTFLRGKHDACVFPMTGYAPMNQEGWMRVFKIARSYGINHYRFHSWCPPDAAFAAADLAGIYLQPELPNFGGDISKNPEGEKYTREEGLRILKAFGNHPSFVMFALGNEMHGGRDVRAGIVKELRAYDPRHLYAQASNYDLGNPEFAQGDDYWTTFRTRKGAEGAVRGSYAHVDAPLGHIQAGPPSTTYDYTRAIESVKVPVIGHEVGQYQTFPNFKEISKYACVLRAWNLDIFRDRLKARGMLDQADDFFKASGALSVICYREEIEAALRTKGFGGFQLLDLQDFPGQGTALVGILDAFMDSKGLIKPGTWHEFCSRTVPLALMSKRSWTVDEAFTAVVKVANYGPSAISNAVIDWELVQQNGKHLITGSTPAVDIARGGLTEMGQIGGKLALAAAPGKLTLTVKIACTDFQNSYDVWVYPSKVETAAPAGVTISRVLDEKTLGILGEGGKVLLMPEAASLPTNSIPGFFAGDFWCYPMFRRGNPPGTLGLLCDPKHPALAGFPTESHSDWQWWPVVMNSRAVIMDDAPAGYRPIVQVIDNFDKDRNHRLGMIFEAKVGDGSLLVCTSDLPGQQDKPEARQMMASLVAYAASDKFKPSVEFSVEILKKMLCR